jgi:hypothetical protein
MVMAVGQRADQRWAGQKRIASLQMMVTHRSGTKAPPLLEREGERGMLAGDPRMGIRANLSLGYGERLMLSSAQTLIPSSNTLENPLNLNWR